MNARMNAYKENVVEAVFQQQVPHIQRVKFREPNPFVEPEQVGNDVAHEHSGVPY